MPVVTAPSPALMSLRDGDFISRSAFRRDTDKNIVELPPAYGCTEVGAKWLQRYAPPVYSAIRDALGVTQTKHLTANWGRQEFGLLQGAILGGLRTLSRGDKGDYLAALDSVYLTMRSAVGEAFGLATFREVNQARQLGLGSGGTRFVMSGEELKALDQKNPCPDGIIGQLRDDTLFIHALYESKISKNDAKTYNTQQRNGYFEQWKNEGISFGDGKPQKILLPKDGAWISIQEITTAEFDRLTHVSLLYGKKRIQQVAYQSLKLPLSHMELFIIGCICTHYLEQYLHQPFKMCGQEKSAQGARRALRDEWARRSDYPHG